MVCFGLSEKNIKSKKYSVFAFLVEWEAKTSPNKYRFEKAGIQSFLKFPSPKQKRCYLEVIA